jgi:hypothetical protein
MMTIDLMTGMGGLYMDDICIAWCGWVYKGLWDIYYGTFGNIYSTRDSCRDLFILCIEIMVARRQPNNDTPHMFNLTQMKDLHPSK